jgi:hypothetical protein
MDPQPRVPKNHSGCQWLVMLAVVAVLLAMLFPVPRAPREASSRAKAKQDALAIVHAVETYASEYEQLPPNLDGRDLRLQKRRGGGRSRGRDAHG